MELRAPPRLEVLEALGAIADDRVRLVSPREAVVHSADRTRDFRVEWDPSDSRVASDDPGTQQHGYFGYPVIAFFMLQGLLPYDPSLASGLKGVRWGRLNEEFPDPRRAAEEVLKRWHWSGRQQLDRFVKWILDMLSEMEVERTEPKGKLTDFV